MCKIANYHTDHCIKILGLLLENGARRIPIPDSTKHIQAYCMSVYDVYQMFYTAMHVPMKEGVLSDQYLRWRVSPTYNVINEALRERTHQHTDPLPAPSDCKHLMFHFKVLPQYFVDCIDDKGETVSTAYSCICMSSTHWDTTDKTHPITGIYAGWVYEDEDETVLIPDESSNASFWQTLYDCLYMTK